MKLVQISFTDWNLLNDTWKYVGLKNWQWLFAGSGAKYLWNSLKVTFLYSMGEILVTMVGGMLLALLFNRMTRSFGLMRAFVFVPKYVAMSSAAVVFLWILNTDSGVLNYLLQCIGLPAVDWLNQQSTALPSVLMLTGWRVIGYGMMIYLSAMMGISQEYYEAASLDGANGVQKFFRITLPLLSPTTLFLLVTTFLSSMKVFQSVDILTSGGPARSTEVFVYLIYRYAMVDFRMDRAATAAVMFFLILLVIPTLFPHEFHPENYLNVLQKANFMKYYWNTIVMTAGILLLQVGTGVLAAYGFAVGRFKGRNALFYVVLGALMIPLQVTFIPIYIMCANWNLCDTFLGLILPEAVSAYYIFMLRNTFMSIDQSYIDAGRIDGLSRLGTIWYVLVPMSKATIFTVTLVTFTNGWNAYFWPKIIAKNEVRRVLTVGLAQLKNTFAGQAVSNYHEIMAGAVLAIIPVVILFLIFQKYMMTGYSKAAMK